jgi:hypothetical protein
VSAPVAPAEPAPAPGAPLSRPAPAPAPPASRRARERLRAVAARGGGLWWSALLIGAVLAWVAFYARGGLNLSRMTTVEMALTIGAALAAAAAVLLARDRRAGYGSWAVGLLLALSALTALSTVWSVQPDASWQDAGRMLAYSAFFAGAVALARAATDRWPAVLGGVILAAVVVCGWALLTKVFPDQLDAADVYARLRAPYSYWNAIGLTAAMGAIACLWLGARRTGHAALSALAYPALGLMLLTLLLAYSRGALVALCVGVVLWLALVPLRLRGAALLVAGAIGSGAVVAWAFSRHALNSDNVALSERAAAGHQLGALILVMLIALAIAGFAIAFITGRRPPTAATRRRAGALLLSLLALALVGSVAALAASHRGLDGSISHAVRSLTDPHASVPPNTPGRLTAVASVRARYWNEALKVFQAHPALGAGAEGYATARLRYRTETLDVRHAHGYSVQTLADLGLVGLVLSIALLGAWMAAAGRATHPFNRRWSGGWRRPRWRREALPYTPERVGMLTLLAVVVVFGVHSFVDWTWYVPGNACVALLCAGWLAGRGPLAPAAARPAGRSTAVLPRGWSYLRAEPHRAALAGGAIVAALLAAWSQWQPQRSVDSSQHALALLARDPRGAEDAAKAAVSRDPLSAQALFTLAAVQRATGRTALARVTLQRAVRLQPSNPQTWIALGELDLAVQRSGQAQATVPGGARAAVNELAAGIYLNPELIAPAAIAANNREAITVQNAYIEALRAAGPSASAATRSAKPPAAKRSSRPAGRRSGAERIRAR